MKYIEKLLQSQATVIFYFRTLLLYTLTKLHRIGPIYYDQRHPIQIHTLIMYLPNQ